MFEVKEEGTEDYDTTPKNPLPNTLYVMDTYHWNATFKAYGCKGSFTVNHIVTTDKAWSKEHLGACSEYFKAVAAATDPKKTMQRMRI